MTLKIVDRKKVLRDFNARNCTTHPHSRYVGVRVDGNRLVFRHVNGSARAVFVPDEGPNHLRGLRVDDSYQN